MVVQQDNISKAMSAQTNYRLCFDGARRGSGSASAGMALIAYYSNGERELLCRAGKILGTLPSAFLAEALAMEWALELVFTTVLAIP